MAHIYWTGAKAPEEEVKKALMEELPDHTDGAFYVKKDSDDTSTHMSVYIEKGNPHENMDFPWKKHLPPKFMGWRLIRIFCPIGTVKNKFEVPVREWE